MNNKEACVLSFCPLIPDVLQTFFSRFAAKTVASGSLVLVTVVTKEGMAAQLTVNCEKMVIGTMLVKDILQALSQ